MGKGLSLSQYQQSGAIFISQLKNVVITAIVASFTINGDMTLGMMMSIQFIIGQLNNPLEQLIAFTRKYQDAKLSLERLNDIYSIEDEVDSTSKLIKKIPHASIKIDKLSFKYDKLSSINVLNSISLDIPQGKTTAIVGLSVGQKQRILIARAVYRDPDYILMDINIDSGESGLQIYKDNVLIGDFKMPAFFIFLVYYDNFYYGVRFKPIETMNTTKFVFYKFAIQ